MIPLWPDRLVPLARAEFADDAVVLNQIRVDHMAKFFLNATSCLLVFSLLVANYRHFVFTAKFH